MSITADEIPAIEINDLQTYFFTKAGVIKAVDCISLSIPRGKILGLVGESGSVVGVDMTDEQLHVHDHLHAYVDENTIPVLDEKGPAERLVTIFEATSVEKDATTISYVGTSGLKVTILDGLDTHKRHLDWL